ncbi:hypothetical protein C8J57DRAFT_1236980 [Mycena rebaudengoi]|nr:hypothetical protein C8J57DRAFT_1236980 [Mycena rebaudengoi]
MSLIPFSSQTVAHSPSRPGILFDGYPGRTVDHMYTRCGAFMKVHANRLAHRLGVGPHASTADIRKCLGHGEERESKLRQLKDGVASTQLRRHCQKLVGYAFPYLGLRCLFVGSDHLKGIGDTNSEHILALWDPSGDCRATCGSGDLNFIEFAAACLADRDISAILEGSSFPLGSVEEGLCPVSKLLVASESDGLSPFSRHISIRYLGGILELPSFWQQSGLVYEAVLGKVIAQISDLLKDLGIDSLSDNFDIDTRSTDTEGIDILCAAVLTGVQISVVAKSPRDIVAWFSGFGCQVSGVLNLLRHPRTEGILPTSWSLAASADLTRLFPTAYSLQSFEVHVPQEDDDTGDEWLHSHPRSSKSTGKLIDDLLSLPPKANINIFLKKFFSPATSYVPETGSRASHQRAKMAPPDADTGTPLLSHSSSLGADLPSNDRFHVHGDVHVTYVGWGCITKSTVINNIGTPFPDNLSPRTVDSSEMSKSLRDILRANPLLWEVLGSVAMDPFDGCDDVADVVGDNDDQNSEICSKIAKILEDTQSILGMGQEGVKLEYFSVSGVLCLRTRPEEPPAWMSSYSH